MEQQICIIFFAIRSVKVATWNLIYQTICLANVCGAFILANGFHSQLISKLNARKTQSKRVWNWMNICVSVWDEIFNYFNTRAHARSHHIYTIKCMFILIEFARGSNIYVDSGIIVCVRGFILFVDIQISDRNEYIEMKYMYRHIIKAYIQFK